jgi:hypothetical protein
VGNDGTFWSLQKDGSWKQLSIGVKKINGRITGTHVSISANGQQTFFNAAHLVMSLFGKEKPEGHFVTKYADGNLLNLRSENLSWVPKMVKNTPETRLLDKDEDVIEARKLYRQGWPPADLARKYHVSIDKIKKALTGETWGHVPDPVLMKRGRMTETDVIEAMKLHDDEGWTFKMLADRYDVSPPTVRNAIELLRSKNSEVGSE